MNEIRLKGYQKALNKCIDLSVKEKDFSMPDIGLDVKNVYSRLYNNYIFKNKRKKHKGKNRSALDINRRNNDFSGRSFNTGSKSSKRNSQERYLYSALNGKKIINFKLKSNLGECEGKDFTIKITPKKLKRCWSNISGGPSVSREEEIKNDAKNRLKAKDILNYKILSYNNKNGDKKDMVLFNTMISSDPNLEENLIKNKNYRDSEYNSSLHIAVKNNSVELVKYFISKNYDLNDKNINGQTPLHLAIEGGNKEIIKLLIDNGADSNIKDNKGRKPIELAKKPKKNTKQA
jgi:ankyrin repeat protein